ncbi:hypothetical protein JCM5350_006135 [Sporobolomyces pararoseus]
MDSAGPLGGSFPPSESSIQSLLDLKQITWARQRYVAAWLGIFLFDLVVTLPEERKYIWNNKWTPLKVLYLLNRYIALAHQIFSFIMIFAAIASSLCHRAWWFEVVGGMIVVYLCALIMSIRIIAIYDRNLLVMGLLGLMLAGEAAVFIYCATLLRAFQLPAFVAQVIGFHGCIAGSRKIQYEKIGGAVWSAPLTFDLVALSLTVFRCFKISQVTGGRRTPLVRKILSTGIFYFAVITASNCVNVVLYSLPSVSPSLQTFHTAASDAITSIMCSRLVLSLFSPDSMSFVSERFMTSHSTAQKNRGRISAHDNKDGIELSKTSASPQLFSNSSPFIKISDLEQARPFEEALVVDRQRAVDLVGGVKIERETFTLASDRG